MGDKTETIGEEGIAPMVCPLCDFTTSARRVDFKHIPLCVTGKEAFEMSQKFEMANHLYGVHDLGRIHGNIECPVCDKAYSGGPLLIELHLNEKFHHLQYALNAYLLGVKP